MNDEIEVIIIEERVKSFHLQSKETGVKEWFPYSQVSFKRRNMKTGDAVAEIPLWLLNSKHGFQKGNNFIAPRDSFGRVIKDRQPTPLEDL